jgi:hypothetical protein
LGGGYGDQTEADHAAGQSVSGQVKAVMGRKSWRPVLNCRPYLLSMNDIPR